MATMGLNKNNYTLVDDEDYDYLNQWKWCIHKGRYTNYVARSVHKSNKIYIYID